jgi:hypothetical protein
MNGMNRLSTEFSQRDEFELEDEVVTQMPEFMHVK